MEGLLDLGVYLQGDGISLMCGDFEEVLGLVDYNTDVIYADPPYMGQCGTYTDPPFSDHDHFRLNTLINASKAAFVLSNAQVCHSTHSHAHVHACPTHTQRQALTRARARIPTHASLGSRHHRVLGAARGKIHFVQPRAQHEQ